MRSCGLSPALRARVQAHGPTSPRSRARTSTHVLSLNPHNARVLKQGDGIAAERASAGGGPREGCWGAPSCPPAGCAGGEGPRREAGAQDGHGDGHASWPLSPSFPHLLHKCSWRCWPLRHRGPGPGVGQGQASHPLQLRGSPHTAARDPRNGQGHRAGGGALPPVLCTPPCPGQAGHGQAGAKDTCQSS